MQTDSPLHWIRKRLFRMSQEAFAGVAGVSRPRISRYEAAGEDPPFKVMARVRREALSRGLPFSADLFFQTAEERAGSVPEDVQ